MNFVALSSARMNRLWCSFMKQNTEIWAERLLVTFFAITLIHYFGVLIFDGTSIFKINTPKIRIEEWIIFAAKAAYHSKN